MQCHGGIKGKEAEKLRKIEKDGAGSSHQDWPRRLPIGTKGRRVGWGRTDGESAELMA